MRTLPATDITGLRARMAQLHQDLTRTTQAYRQAAADHDSQRVIPLLRSRSQLMRQLLEAQCELLLSFRSVGDHGPIPVAMSESHDAHSIAA